MISWEGWYDSTFKLDKSCDYTAYTKLAKIHGDFAKILDDNFPPEHGRLWLAGVCVDPKFQRKGVGKRLLAWGMNRGKEENVSLGLISSPKGKALYESLGFKAVYSFEGLPEELNNPLMKWQPRDGLDAVQGLENTEETDDALKVVLPAPEEAILANN